MVQHNLIRFILSNLVLFWLMPNLLGNCFIRDKPLAEIDQLAIDNAAHGVYPLAPRPPQPPVLYAGLSRAEARGN